MTELPFGFCAPEDTFVGEIALGELIGAIESNDGPALAHLRAMRSADAHVFDRFVEGIHYMHARDFLAADGVFLRIESAEWQPWILVLRAVALAATGDVRQAISIANDARDLIKRRTLPPIPGYAGNLALLREGFRCITSCEARFPVAPGPLRVDAPFRYIISYPRSGSGLLRQFLSHAFAAPRYSVYPGDGWYFSRTFHDPEPGHAVFVKDHVFRDEYFADPLLFLVRDGRDAVISLARFLYAGGGTTLVRRGELADFLTYLAERNAFGFWADHARRLIDARTRGASVRIVRYEDVFRNYRGLRALALEVADGMPLQHDDEAQFEEFSVDVKRNLALEPSWSESVVLPGDTYVPTNWSVGGGTIDWREAFDAAARRRFHELGGTDILIQLGYETNDRWWKQA